MTGTPRSLQKSRTRVSGWLDPAADPDPGPSAEMRACGEEQGSGRSRREPRFVAAGNSECVGRLF
jgi:hypothetical protein